MNYKLIALDLDDTLLTPDKQISQKNAAAVRRAADAGVHIVIASGRAYDGTTQFAERLGIRDYTIAVAGGLIYDPEGHVVYGQYIPPQTAHDVMEWAMERGIHFQIYCNDGLYFLERNVYTDRYERTCELTGHADPDLLSENVQAAKILYIDSESVIEKCRTELGARFPQLSVLTSQLDFLEIGSRAASKGAALAYLAGLLHIPVNSVMAIGDSRIDRSMLEFAGMGVAVGNASREIQDAADLVAPACADDGVAWVIDRLVLRD